MEKARYFNSVISEKGKFRKINEDAFLIEKIESSANFGYILGVFDGVGGSDQGEVASSYTKESFSSFIREKGNDMFDLEDKEVISLINNEIMNIHYTLIRRGEEKKKFYGTTLTLLLALNTRYFIAQVGDSRMYMFSERQGLKKVTEDQNKFELYKKKGISLVGNDKEKAKTVITQCVGKGILNPIYSKGIFPDTYEVILSTDGFYRKLLNSEIERIFTYEGKKEEILSKSIKIARERKETDDLTVIYLRKEYK